jgi:DNA-binding NtrC family response regulator
VAVETVQHEATTPAEPAGATRPGTGDGLTLRSIRNRAEIQAIQQALGYAGWNRRRAAELLEISYRSLLLKIQRHKITRQMQ